MGRCLCAMGRCPETRFPIWGAIVIQATDCRDFRMKSFTSIAVVFVMAACSSMEVNEPSEERRGWEYNDRDLRSVLKELTAKFVHRFVEVEAQPDTPQG